MSIKKWLHKSRLTSTLNMILDNNEYSVKRLLIHNLNKVYVLNYSIYMYLFPINNRLVDLNRAIIYIFTFKSISFYIRIITYYIIIKMNYMQFF